MQDLRKTLEVSFKYMHLSIGQESIRYTQIKDAQGMYNVREILEVSLKYIYLLDRNL